MSYRHCDHFRMSDNLTVQNVDHLLQEVSAAECYGLGIQLGIEPSKLHDLELGPVQKFRPKMIEIWLEGDPQHSWEKLACALKRVNKNVLAENVLAEHARSLQRKRLSSGYGSDSGTSKDLDEPRGSGPFTRKLQDMRSGTFC